MGWPLSDGTGTRELFVRFGGSGYAIRYRRTARGEVFILRVWHSRERRT
jgi:plasmid stabilization system protein ParE